jgi:hypothetical protein
MRAVAVFPGTPGSAHLTELADPSIDDVPGGRGVLVRIIRVGLDGTDREISAGAGSRYGIPAAPPSSAPAPSACWPP